MTSNKQLYHVSGAVYVHCSICSYTRFKFIPDTPIVVYPSRTRVMCADCKQELYAMSRHNDKVIFSGPPDVFRKDIIMNITDLGPRFEERDI